MKRIILVVAIFTILVPSLPYTEAAVSENTRYTLVFKGNGIPKEISNIVTKAGGELVKVLPEIGVAITVSDNPNFADSLKKGKTVDSVGLEQRHSLPPTDVMEYAVEAGPEPFDFYYPTYQWNILRINADLTWPITSGSHNTVIAVIDTGIAWNHPDLEDNVVYRACYSSTEKCDNYPFATYDEGGWHGTHIAGIIAAAFGGGGMIGVGPNLGLASYKVFEQIPGCGYCAYDESIWEAMLDAVNRGYQVINLSLGGLIDKSEDAATWTAWNRVANYVRKKAVVVASAGNDSIDLNGSIANIPSDLPGVVSVGGTGIRPEFMYPMDGSYDVLAYYSNFGAAVTLVAPGGDWGGLEPFTFPAGFYLILSSFVSMPGTPIILPEYVDNCEENANCPVSHFWVGGTSQSAAHVSGVVGLMLDHNPKIKPSQVKAILKRTAENLGDRQQFGHGMLDALEALSSK